MRKLWIGSLSLIFIFSLLNPMLAMGEIKQSKIGDENQMHRETDVMGILSVLEKRIGDQKLLEKAKGKLITLRNPEFDLITSLSGQIKKEGERPGVEIAFLLITALIILS